MNTLKNVAIELVCVLLGLYAATCVIVLGYVVLDLREAPMLLWALYAVLIGVAPRLAQHYYTGY